MLRSAVKVESAEDAAAWAAVRAARGGAVVQPSLARHPLCRMLLPIAIPEAIVVAQLGQSLDGRIATVAGDSYFINGSGGLDHLHRLRALVDAVIVGVGTVAADDCRLTVRRVDGTCPARVVVDPNGRAAVGARAFADDGQIRLVIRADDAPDCAAPGVEIVRLPRVDGRLPPAAIIEALAQRGLRRVLVEGGAGTVSAFIAADAVDRLHVMAAPVIIGSGRPGLELAPIADMANARRPATSVHALGGGDILFDCDMRSPAPPAARHEGD